MADVTLITRNNSREYFPRPSARVQIPILYFERRIFPNEIYQLSTFNFLDSSPYERIAHTPAKRMRKSTFDGECSILTQRRRKHTRYASPFAELTVTEAIAPTREASPSELARAIPLSRGSLRFITSWIM